MKKRLLRTIVVTATAGAAVLALLFGWRAVQGEPDPTILTVNGRPVEKEEFQLFMQEERSKVSTYFKTTYHADDQKGFWTKSFGGERPIDRLKKEAEQVCIEYQAVLSLAGQQGLVKDISFKGVEAARTAYNQAKAKAAGSSQAVYGMTYDSLAQFYPYYIDNLKNQLKTALSAKELRVTDEEISQYYAAHSDAFTVGRELTVEECFIPYGANQAEAQTKARQAEAELQQGSTFEAVCGKYAQDGRPVTRKLTESAGSAMSSEAALFRQAGQMQVGGYSPVLDEGDGAAIIRLVADNHDVKTDLSTVKSQIGQELVNQKFDALLQQKIDTARVTRNVHNEQALSAD